MQTLFPQSKKRGGFQALISVKNKNIRNVPKLRFPGFEGEWEQRKIDDIVVEYNERTTTNNQFEILSSTHEGIKFQKDHFNKVTASADTTGYKIVPKGFFTYRSMSDNGVFVFNQQNIINKGIVSPAYPVFDVIKADKMFFKQYINNTFTIKRELIRIKEGGTRYALSFSKLRSIVLQFPSLQEQTKIGSFLATIDALISETEKELEACREQKRGMLQKMFPKKGEKVPEIRFSEFTGDWEQRKLGELCNITTGKLDANAMVSDGQYDFYTSGIKVFKIDKAAFEGPAITIAGNGNVGYMHLADGKFNAYQRTYVLTDFSANRYFLNAIIGKNLPHKLYEETRGSTIPYIVLNMLTDLAIPFPSHEEQYAIGVYFQQLDNLITLHQRELDKLIELKKGFMQKMFC